MINGAHYELNQSSSGPNRKGLLLSSSWIIAPFLFCRISTSFFNFVFSYISWLNFWFIIVLLLDFKMERSLMRFFIVLICYSRSLMTSFRLANSFYNSLFLSVIFFRRISSYLSLSFSPWICTSYFVIFYPFFSKFYFVWDSISCLCLSHSLFFSSKFYLIYSYCLNFSSSYS